MPGDRHCITLATWLWVPGMRWQAILCSDNPRSLSVRQVPSADIPDVSVRLTRRRIRLMRRAFGRAWGGYPRRSRSRPMEQVLTHCRFRQSARTSDRRYEPACPSEKTRLLHPNCLTLCRFPGPLARYRHAWGHSPVVTAPFGIRRKSAGVQ